jgi:VIT1/CCC1 family predicted Fe2+/Mn2+ transporter
VVKTPPPNGKKYIITIYMQPKRVTTYEHLLPIKWNFVKVLPTVFGAKEYQEFRETLEQIDRKTNILAGFFLIAGTKLDGRVSARIHGLKFSTSGTGSIIEIFQLLPLQQIRIFSYNLSIMKQTANIPNPILKQIISDQQNEIEAYTIYGRMSELIKDEQNADILRQIAADEQAHFKRLRSITQKEIKPRRLRIFFFVLITRIFGLTFGLKLLERKEAQAVNLDYKGLETHVPGLAEIIKQEEEHEKKLIGMIEEQRLSYLGSVVLGLNDALVELTGTLAGLSFAFQNTEIIALSGLITGIAASFSMAASEYLSSKADGEEEPLKSSTYTGLAYILTVVLLILPYLIFDHYLVCLAVTLAISVAIIGAFNYYISVAKGYSFIRRFAEMTAISLGVAGFSFAIGVAVRVIFGVEI